LKYVLPRGEVAYTTAVTHMKAMTVALAYYGGSSGYFCSSWILLAELARPLKIIAETLFVVA